MSGGLAGKLSVSPHPARIQGKAGKIFIQPASGPPVKVATKSEWKVNVGGVDMARAVDARLNELEARLTPKQEELLNQILATLVMQAGGEIVIPEAALAYPDETVIIEVDEQVGMVKITHIPDYVKTGYEAVPSEFTTPMDEAGQPTEESTYGKPFDDHGRVIPPSYFEKAIEQAQAEKTYQEWRKYLENKVSDVFGVPPAMVGFDPAIDDKP